MSNSQTQGIPGMDAMNETLDFVKNLWSGMSMPGMKIPGMIMPSLSVEEINKQIADLKTVESWLTLNMNMLRSTIQALEVQSATISTLQAMGESLSAAVAPQPKAEPPAVKAAQPEPIHEPAPEPEPEAAATQPNDKAKGKPQAEAVPPMPNPAIWWNMLQDQFKQAVGSAMAAEADPVKAAPKPKNAAPKGGSSPKTVPKETSLPKAKAARPARVGKGAKRLDAEMATKRR